MLRQLKNAVSTYRGDLIKSALFSFIIKSVVLLSFVFTFASLPFFSVINAVCLYCRWRFSVLYDVVLRSPGEEVMANNTANWYFPHWMLTAGLVVFFARSKSGYFTKMFSGTVEQCSTLCIFCTVVYTLYFLLLSNKTMGKKPMDYSVCLICSD